jgi:hypothetical protein
VSTDQSVHVLKESGAPVVSVPRAYDRQKYGLRSVGRLENPERYVFWYTGSWYLDPEEFASVPGQLLEYDAKGHKIAHRELPRGPSEAPTAQVLIGLATPMTEAALLTGVTRSLRSGERLNHGMEASILLNFLEHWTWYFIPGLARASAPQRPLVPGFIALTLVSATACALVCFLLARRYAFSRARRVGWALCGFLFGPAGLLLMLCLQEWPARVACPSCRKARVVTRDTCEHCGALHAAPAPDGTEVFEEPAEAPPAPAAVSVT